MSDTATTCFRQLSRSGGWPRQSLRAIVFREWRVVTLLETRARLEATTQRWSEQIQTMHNLLMDNMRLELRTNPDELIETCIAELGYTRAVCVIRNLMRYHESLRFAENPTTNAQPTTQFPEYDPSQDFERLGATLGEQPLHSGASGSAVDSNAVAELAQTMVSQLPLERLNQLLETWMILNANVNA